MGELRFKLETTLMLTSIKTLLYSTQRNEIGAEGAEKIAEALKINNTLTSLNLGVSVAVLPLRFLQ